MVAVLQRSELNDSPLADLHAIADQIGLEGFRRLRKAELIEAILGEPASDAAAPDAGDSHEEMSSAADGEPRSAAARARRSRRGRSRGDSEEESPRSESDASEAKRDGESEREEEEEGGEEERPRRESRRGRGRQAEEQHATDRLVDGVVELLGNGSAFLRVKPPEASDEDVYISAAQVRRCELVSGDRVTGPLRTPRRSERYPSLVRVDTINGAPAGEVSEGARYEDRPVAYPSERLALDSDDATLRAIEWLTPFGRGSRVVIAGPARVGKTEILRRLLGALSGREGLEVTVALAGVRPEEIAEWGEGPAAPVTTLTFAASADAQGQALERATETATRTAARGGDALLLIDTLDGLHPQVARKVMACARNLRDGGSLTIVATASSPFGGESTVIALDPALASAGGPPLDLATSGTVRPELLVGEEGATAIAQARASALESSS
jgi:transcription termination factor Rho